MNKEITLNVELETGADPVQGTIGTAEGASKPFSGYVQLIAALESYRVEGAMLQSGGFSGGRDNEAQGDPVGTVGVLAGQYGALR